ncbi:MAG: hypothetical protein K6B14_07870 [Lachnospiraceae bacterium]|nr:hypothetical protein [Lachnospiraceae bacterium]
MMSSIMSDVGYVTIYANGVAIMLLLGILVLSSKLRLNDENEKRIFSSLLVIALGMAVFYIIISLRDEGIIPCSHMGAMLIESAEEFLLIALMVQWVIYMDYRMYHSPGHLKRNLNRIIVPVALICLCFIINIFTGFMFYFDENLVYTETALYYVVDIIRLLFFIIPIVMLARRKKVDENIRFFTIRPFFVSILFYVGIYYITPYSVAALGISIGFALIYVDVVNAYRYQDTQTGFFNRNYLLYLKDLIRDDEYELNSAMLFTVPGDDIENTSKLIHAQLPDDCEPIRYAGDKILTLAHVKDRSPLHMVSEDVEMSLTEAGIPVAVAYDLRKKKETGSDFLERFLKKADGDNYVNR